MLGVLAVLGFALVIVAILYGRLTKNFQNDLSSQSSTPIQKIESKKENKNDTVEIESEATPKVDYELLERNVATITERYVKEKNGVPFGNTTYISLSEMKTGGYLDAYDESLSECRGYVEYRSSDQTYQTYLNCRNYQTSGYNVKYEN